MKVPLKTRRKLQSEHTVQVKSTNFKNLKLRITIRLMMIINSQAEIKNSN